MLTRRTSSSTLIAFASVMYRLSFDLGPQVSDVTLQQPDAAFTTTLVNLIHRPLSDFFIVDNESQYGDSVQTAGRGIVVKYTQMFAF